MPNRIYIPTFISDANFSPARVKPRVFFYNGMVDCEPYYVDHWTDSSGTTREMTAVNQFPYLDHYSAASGSFPDSTSESLLFLNEPSVYNRTPNQSLYSQYWSTYISLLYNPVTRLLNASAVLPLSVYFALELNDIVDFRGNYYHLRAINDYNLTTGECTVQLLGPIIPDTLNEYFSYLESGGTIGEYDGGIGPEPIE